jgi:hypothetical protein
VVAVGVSALGPVAPHTGIIYSSEEAIHSCGSLEDERDRLKSRSVPVARLVQPTLCAPGPACAYESFHCCHAVTPDGYRRRKARPWLVALLVGVDGSPASALALRWALNQGALTGAAVEAVNA